jgi:hypothetical protein
MNPAIIQLLDLAITAMSTVERINKLMETARAEGREITVEEVDALVAESADLRNRFDNAGQ